MKNHEKSSNNGGKKEEGRNLQVGGCMGAGRAADLALFAAFGACGAADLGAADLVGISNKSFGLFLFGCLQQLSSSR